MKQPIRTVTTVLPLVLAYGYLLCFPKDAASAVTDGLRLCVTVVLPSLFPYFVLTNCVVSSGLLHCGGSGISAFVLGLLGGYPIGAKTLATGLRSKHLTEKESSELLPYCNNAGAALFLSMIGSKLFGSLRIGGALYLIHILAALVVAQLFRSDHTEAKVQPQEVQSTSLHFVASVRDAAQTALTVCAFITVFAVLSQAVGKLTVRQPVLALLATGILELSGGCCLAAQSAYPLFLRTSLCSLFAGWGGLCVHAQTAAVLENRSICFSAYLIAKALHGALAFSLTCLFFLSPIYAVVLLFGAVIFFQKIRLEKFQPIRYNKKKRRYE